MTTDQNLYDELAFYTLSHPDPAFVHQHLVDAYAAQHADGGSKPITVVFALIGLYLHMEKNFTGRQVQRIHMQLAKRRKEWPRLLPPQERGAITVAAVAATPPGAERDEMIRDWCRSVWAAWSESQSLIRETVNHEIEAESFFSPYPRRVTPSVK